MSWSWSQDPIDGGLIVCMSHNHNHSIFYKVDNGSVFDMIESTIQGHKVAATTAPFCCAWDGCGAQFVLTSQHDGKAIYDQLVNSLTAKFVPVGTKNSRPVGFYGRNSTKSTLHHKHNNHKHHHHGGAVCPSYGMGSMDPPDRTRVTSSEGVGRGGGGSG